MANRTKATNGVVSVRGDLIELQDWLRKGAAINMRSADKYAVVPGLPACTAADSRRRAERFTRWADALESAIEELSE